MDPVKVVDNVENEKVNVVNGEKVNVAFDGAPEYELNTRPSNPTVIIESKDPEVDERPHQQWNNPIEFLMSCIATSIGLGNVWRFPFVAYKNGGGAFLIPYVIVLFVIGKPMYYLETVLGQFSSSNIIRIWALSPAMKGASYAQFLGAIYVLSYYVSIIALCLFYFGMSFQSTLPWAICQEEWGDICVPSGRQTRNIETNVTRNYTSSAELYFTKTVLRQSDGLDGLGLPIWDLTLCLFASWLMIFFIVARGVKSSGKASYFLALFPYVVLIILLIRAVTLEGAIDGILFFIRPDWGKLLTVEVWYAAVTQVFFSLSVCSGAVIMFSSFNGFTTNIYRDSMIVTTLDTLTSLMSGITIFSILGNLAFELGNDDVGSVIGGGGTGLAFISYPDAIAKSPFAPQLFAVLFFLMMSVLGIGSGVALLSTVNNVIQEFLPKTSITIISAVSCSAGFLVGLIYVTPEGQYILELVDYYGGTFMRLFAAIIESIGVTWIYGLENVCIDIEFMLGIKTSFYWRICWAIITPVIMIVVFLYALINTETLIFGEDYTYPTIAYAFGAILQYAGIVMIPILMIVALWKYRSSTFAETVKAAFRKQPSYGPREPAKKAEWIEFCKEAEFERELKRKSYLHHIWLCLSGGYRN